jgi:hypothetical protein
VSQVVALPRGQLAPPTPPGARDVRIFFAGKTKGAAGYASRRLFCDMVHLHQPKPAATICDGTKGITKPTVEEKAALLAAYFRTTQHANFSGMIRGDTPTSGRLYDMFATGTIPLLLSDNIWGTGLPFPEKVPWKRLLIVVEEQQTYSTNNFTAQEATAAQDRMFARVQTATAHIDVASILADMKGAAADLLWHVGESRVADNLVEAAENKAVGFAHVAAQTSGVIWRPQQTTQCYAKMRPTKHKNSPLGLVKVPECGPDALQSTNQQPPSLAR